MTLVGPTLALDSATPVGSVAVGDAGGVRAERELSVAGAHSAALLPAIDAVLREAGLRPADLAAVVVGAGPGSFTGLRIAAATAKGIVRALGIPLLAYPSLLAAAAGGRGEPGPVVALFDARGRDVFAGGWTFDGGLQVTGDRLQPAVTRNLSPVTSLFPPTALTLDEVVERFAAGEPPLFLGDGAVRHGAELRERVPGCRVGAAEEGVPRAAHLLWLAGVDAEAGLVAEPATWEPEYGRAAGVERIAAARAAESGA